MNEHFKRSKTMNSNDNFAQDTAVSMSTDNPKDIEAIASVIQAYAEGGRRSILGRYCGLKPRSKRRATG